MDKHPQGFRFKQFTLQHNCSTMKVGTDAVLLGSWAMLNAECFNLSSQLSALNFLDIGCGCGVIALMLAQRFPKAQVTGIDIDEASVLEARQNALDSPFADRVDFRVADVRQLAGTPWNFEPGTPGTSGPYDLIVSNPPFYHADTISPDERRAIARNAHNLLPEELILSAKKLLTDNGSFALIVPMEVRDYYVDTALLSGLYLQRETQVRTTPRKYPKRVLLQFTKSMPDTVFVPETLCLLNPDGSRSNQYQNLCHDFYL